MWYVITHLIHITNIWDVCQHFINKVVCQQNLYKHQHMF